MKYLLKIVIIIKTPLKYPIFKHQKPSETMVSSHGFSGCQGYPAAALKLHYKDAELISISPLPTKGPGSADVQRAEDG